MCSSDLYYARVDFVRPCYARRQSLKRELRATGKQTALLEGFFPHVQGIPSRLLIVRKNIAGFSRTQGIPQGLRTRRPLASPHTGEYRAVGLHRRLHGRHRRFSPCTRNITTYSSRKTASRYCNPPQNGIYCDYIPTRGRRSKQAYTTPH